jgi:hypothetical protein
MIQETMHSTKDGVDNVVNKATNEGSSSISSEEQALVKMVMKKFNQFKKVRNRYDKNWMNFYKLFRGAQWSGNRPKWKNSEIINLIFPTIQSQIPLQTDSRPKFNFLPTEPTDAEFAAIMDKVGECDWDKYNWMDVLFSVLLDGYVFGSGVSSMGYNPGAEFGVGAPVYQDEEPLYCYPDPECQDVNDPNSEGFFHVKPTPTARVRRDYPQRADEIKPDIKDWVKQEKTSLKQDDFGIMYTDRDMPESGYQTHADDGNIPRTLVFHYYSKPDDVEQDVEEKEDGKKVYTARKKYPKGRYLVVASGIVLRDGPLPFEDGLIPFSKYDNYKLPREFWGISEIEQLESPQRIFNKILCFALDSLVYAGNPIWVIDTSSDVDEETLSNIPGAIVQKTPGSEVRREPGVQLNPSFLQVLDRLITWFNDAAGNSEFSKGQAPGSVTAASAIEQLISASRTRIRQKQRNLDTYMRTVGRQYANRIFEFYKAPRVYRITGQDGAQKFFKFNTASEPDETGSNQRVAYYQEYEPNEGGQQVPGEVRKMIIMGDFDIRVSTGSDLPFEAADKERKALALFDRQIIDAEEVLDQLNYPNKDKILARMQQLQIQAQQQAMAQQQQGQAPQPTQVQEGV